MGANGTLITCPACGTTNRVPPAQPGRKVLCGKCKRPLDAGSASTVHVTDGRFVDEVERSPLPVLLDLWAEWCGPCKQLSPVLERLAAEGGGSWVLAKVDVDANPALAQGLRVQGIPAVKAVWQGQLVAEFTGAIPEEQARQFVDELVKATTVDFSSGSSSVKDRKSRIPDSRAAAARIWSRFNVSFTHQT